MTRSNEDGGQGGLGAVLAAIEAQEHGGHLELTPEEASHLLGVAVRAAGAILSSEEDLPAPPDERMPSATDVVQVCNWLLKAVDLQPFELGFWRNFSGGLRTSPEG